jgi:hypothetical protein
MYTLWIWRFTVDLRPNDVAFVAVAFIVTAGPATRGHPARMLDFRGTPLVGSRSRTYWNQLIFCGLFLPAGVAIVTFGHRL